MSLSFSIVLLLAIHSNSTYAQLSKTIAIKITSPAKGQQIPVGIRNLSISGTSAFDSTMSCQVWLIVDDVKPYQKAMATHGGDYSSWNYTLTPNYTIIKQGPNKLTAKLSCHDNSMNVTKFYSLNITGVTYSSKQVAVSSSKSNITNQMKNETVKAAPLMAKHNMTATSTALKRTEQPPSTLNVNGMLARTGTLTGALQQAATQSDTNSTTVSHHARATTGKTGMLVVVSDEAHTPNRNLEKLAIPSNFNNTASNNTASNNTASTGTSTTGTLGKVSIPISANGTLGKVSIPPSGVNITFTNPQPHANITAPFFFASPLSSLRSTSSSAPPVSRHNNSPQTLQLLPIANAGPAQIVTMGSTVILNGSGSRAPSGIILSYSWNQMPTNAKITLSGVNTPVWEFTAPIVSTDTLLRFQLTVTDNLGQTGTDTVNILDKPASTTKAPVRAQILKEPTVSANIPQISQNKGSNIVTIPTNNAKSPRPLIPQIPPPLIPQIPPPVSQ
ncbi:MAG TPA: hypothetical protein VFI73_12895 [Candidatus Nitrosopolaris sp.]|nr:hypothetical protein [Candidatus Nitrosopolaris sp.]